MKRIVRFLKALWKYLLYGNRVSFETYVDRLNFCNSCEHLNREKWQCNICGCYMDKKCKMNTEHCSVKKW